MSWVTDDGEGQIMWNGMQWEITNTGIGETLLGPSTFENGPSSGESWSISNSTTFSDCTAVCESSPIPTSDPSAAPTITLSESTRVYIDVCGTLMPATLLYGDLVLSDDGFFTVVESEDDIVELAMEEQSDYSWYEPVAIEVSGEMMRGFVMIPQSNGGYTVQTFDDSAVHTDLAVESLQPLVTYTNGSFVEAETCSWSSATITSIEASGVYATSLGDDTFTINQIRPQETRYSILEEVTVQDSTTGAPKTGTIIGVEDERNTYTIVYSDGLVEYDVSASRIDSSRRNLQEEEPISISCEEPIGLVQDAGQTCKNVLAIYGCDTDLSTLHPGVPEGSFLALMCPCSCANERRRLQGVDEALYMGDSVVLDGGEQGIIRIVQGDNVFTIEMDSGTVYSDISGDRLSYVASYSVGDSVEVEQCVSYPAEIVSRLLDGRYEIEFLNGARTNVDYHQLSSSSGYLRMYDKVSVKIDGLWEPNYEIIATNPSHVYTLRHIPTSSILENIYKNSIQLVKPFQLNFT